MTLTRRGKVVVAVLVLLAIKLADYYTLPTECRAAHWYSVSGFPDTPECRAIRQ